MNHILIIDDASDLRDLLRIYFEAKGYLVTQANSGRSALDLIAEERPDLIITDIIMPDVSGIEMIKTLRKGDRRLPVVALSGFPEELQQVERLGVTATFLKPPNLNELGRLIELTLGKKSA